MRSFWRWFCFVGIFFLASSVLAQGRQYLVMKVEGSRVYVDMGEENGAVVGAMLEVYREGEVMIHPVTGERMTGKPEVVGLIRLKEVWDKFAVGELLRLEEGQKVREMDRIRMPQEVPSRYRPRGYGSDDRVEHPRRELGVTGSYAAEKRNDENSTTVHRLNVDGVFGYFLFTRLELGIQVSTAWVKGGDTHGAGSAFAAFHLRRGSMVVPYLGGGFGHTFGGALAAPNGENTMLLEGFIGVKVFVAPRAAVVVQPSFTRQNFDQLQVDTIGVQVGVSVFF